MFISFASFFMGVLLFFSSFFTVLDGTTVAEISVDSKSNGNVIPNIVSNVNVWDMGTAFYNQTINQEYNIFEFVDYIQLMQCTGGTPERDLFENPYDTTVLDDYDFTRLINNCSGIINLGAKPLLKLGGIPCKFTKDYVYSDFGMNLYPPDDYDVYYNYIKACIGSLVDEFGADEVRSWRFGTLTEYENGQWFKAKSGDPKDTAIEFCKVYDYTVQAITDVLGEDFCIGAHSMTVTEGFWNEKIFIEHIAKGINYANGKVGTHCDYLSASFYDSRAGEFTTGYNLPKTVGYLKKTAEKYGLNNLFYGIDEGRILSGTPGSVDNQLLTRVVGDRYMSAYDARLFTQGINSGLEYFSTWGFFSNGLIHGNPSLCYHIADKISDFSGSKQLNNTVSKASINRDEVGCLSAINENDGTVRLMVYDFKNKVAYDKNVKIDINVKVNKGNGETVKVTKYYINDDCNYFDDFRLDREKYGITDECFSWSPDDINISSNLLDGDFKKLYQNELEGKYAECSVLKPIVEEKTVVDGCVSFKEEIIGNSVLFIEIN